MPNNLRTGLVASEMISRTPRACWCLASRDQAGEPCRAFLEDASLVSLGLVGATSRI